MNLKEIAAALNVSSASVSIVRKGKAGVSQNLRRRIQLALDANGYSYKEYIIPGGASLPVAPKSKRRYIRLLKYYQSALLTDKNEGFVDGIINAIGAYARTNGYSVILSTVSHDEYGDFLLEMAHDECKGLLVLATEMDRDDILKLKRFKIPLVVLDSDHPSLPFSTVTMDNRDIAYQATSHLFSLGVKDVGYLRSAIRTGNFIGRENGYCEALRVYGRSWKEDHVFNLTPSLSGACQDMCRYLAQGRRVPRALFADNDVLAIGALPALAQYDLTVPQRVYLIGVDNTVLANISTPSLSSMQIPRSVIGEMAIAELIRKIEQPELDPVHIHVCAQLIARESTGRSK